MKLNVNFIRRRQRELGLSRRQVASGTGIGRTRADQMLEGQQHHTLTLANLAALADTLGCTIPDLLASDEQYTTNTESDGDQADLPATLGALLISAPRAVSGAGLARTTGQDLATVTQALDVLRARLGGVGMTLRRDTNDGAYSIIATAGATTEEQVKAVLRAANARVDMDLGTAKAVYSILSGTVTRRTLESSNNGRVLLGRLINEGIVKQTDARNAPLELTDDVRQSLLLDVR